MTIVSCSASRNRRPRRFYGESGPDRVLAVCRLGSDRAFPPLLHEKDREDDEARDGDEADQLQPATATGVAQPASAGGEQRENCGDEEDGAPGVSNHRCRRSRETQEEDEPPVFGSRRRPVELRVLCKADTNGLLERHALPPDSSSLRLTESQVS